MSRYVLGVVGLSVLVLTLSNAQASLPAVVYDNLTTSTTGSWTPDAGIWQFSYYPGDPIGELITLAGDQRKLCQFDLMLGASQQTTIENLSLTLYLDDGPDILGDLGAPGTILWSATRSNVLVNNSTLVTFNIPDEDNVIVPDSFIWIASGGSSIAGLRTFDPPVVGTSTDDIWDLDSPTGKWCLLNFESDPVANFGARIYATPEPASAMLLILGVARVVFRKRR